MTVMVSEMFVDWLKHAFITKFNHIRPSVYERFTDVLCRDLATGSAFGRLGRKVCSIHPSDFAVSSDPKKSSLTQNVLSSPSTHMWTNPLW